MHGDVSKYDWTPRRDMYALYAATIRQGHWMDRYSYLGGNGRDFRRVKSPPSMLRILYYLYQFYLTSSPLISSLVAAADSKLLLGRGSRISLDREFMDHMNVMGSKQLGGYC